MCLSGQTSLSRSSGAGQEDCLLFVYLLSESRCTPLHPDLGDIPDVGAPCTNRREQLNGGKKKGQCSHWPEEASFHCFIIHMITRFMYSSAYDPCCTVYTHKTWIIERYFWKSVECGGWIETVWEEKFLWSLVVRQQMRLSDNSNRMRQGGCCLLTCISSKVLLMSCPWKRYIRPNLMCHNPFCFVFPPQKGLTG